MSEKPEITVEESYKKFPFLKKLNSEDIVQLLMSLLRMALTGGQSNDTLLDAIKVILKE